MIGPAHSSAKYGCIHDDLLQLGLRNHSRPARQLYEVSGARKLQSGGTTQFASMRFYLDATRLFPGK